MSCIDNGEMSETWKKDADIICYESTLLILIYLQNKDEIYKKQMWGSAESNGRSWQIQCIAWKYPPLLRKSYMLGNLFSITEFSQFLI